MKKSHEVTLWNPETRHFVSFLLNVWGQPYIVEGILHGLTYELTVDHQFVSKEEGNRRYVALRLAGYVIWKPDGVWAGYPYVLG